MKLTVFLFLFCIAGFVKSQDTVIDSAEAKIEKYYNIDLPDSVRSHLKSQIDHMNKYIAQDSLNPKAFFAERDILWSAWCSSEGNRKL